mmetsp:Transcript_46957/g.102123  ORF Transcript_46957/g.102123 Transcript_46957/m.102123 type:complete len:238 (-) Transcript_46957:309-1022(-)
MLEFLHLLDGLVNLYMRHLYIGLVHQGLHNLLLARCGHVLGNLHIHLARVVLRAGPDYCVVLRHLPGVIETGLMRHRLNSFNLIMRRSTSTHLQNSLGSASRADAVLTKRRPCRRRQWHRAFSAHSARNNTDRKACLRHSIKRKFPLEAAWVEHGAGHCDLALHLRAEDAPVVHREFKSLAHVPVLKLVRFVPHRIQRTAHSLGLAQRRLPSAHHWFGLADAVKVIASEVQMLQAGG